jgi:hypothetical protein
MQGILARGRSSRLRSGKTSVRSASTGTSAASSPEPPRDANNHSATLQVPVEIHGKPPVIAFNPRYLADGL